MNCTTDGFLWTKRSKSNANKIHVQPIFIQKHCALLHTRVKCWSAKSSQGKIYVRANRKENMIAFVLNVYIDFIVYDFRWIRCLWKCLECNLWFSRTLSTQSNRMRIERKRAKEKKTGHRESVESISFSRITLSLARTKGNEKKIPKMLRANDVTSREHCF